VSSDWLSAWEFHTVMCHNGVIVLVVTRVRVVGLRRFEYIDWTGRCDRQPAIILLSYHTR